MDNPLEFNLTIHVPADEWAYVQRRVTYLESLLIRVLRDKTKIKEWYDARELAGLALPGLPSTAQGITRKATIQKWLRRKSTGNCFQYHYFTLPERAFDALIGQLLKLPKQDRPAPQNLDLPPAPVPRKIPIPDNAAPSWVLPLMRLLKGEAQGDLTRAWADLPDHLPIGTSLPDVDEAASTLIRLGLV